MPWTKSSSSHYRIPILSCAKNLQWKKSCCNSWGRRFSLFSSFCWSLTVTDHVLVFLVYVDNESMHELKMNTYFLLKSNFSISLPVLLFSPFVVSNFLNTNTDWIPTQMLKFSHHKRKRRIFTQRNLPCLILIKWKQDTAHKFYPHQFNLNWYDLYK